MAPPASTSLERVLVTGLGGFAGTHLHRALAARGAEVRGYGLGAPPAAAGGPPLAGWRAGDVLDHEALGAAVADARPTHVVHLAGQASAALSYERPVETYRANAIGTWQVLDAVAAHAPRARVLVVGSGEVYGPQPEGSRVAEDAPFRPVSPYALSKAAADALSDAFARTHGLAVIRTRSFGHTGPGQSPAFAIPSFARQIADIEAGRSAPVLRVGNLEVTRDLTDVRDVVEAYLTLLERGRPGAAYNVCRGEGRRLTQVVADMVARARATIRIELDPSRVRPADLPYLVGDPAAIARDTGWSATIPLEQTLADVLEAWRRKGP
jgi:GDP-4-dehydro-6-deoxy-D-mannose reductase